MGEALEQLRRVVQMAPTAMIAVRQDGTIIMGNAAAHKLFAAPDGGLIDTNVDELVAGPVRAHHGDLRDQFHEEPEPRRMTSRRGIYAQRRDGTTLPVDVGLNPVELDGEMVVLTGIVDISAQRRAQQRVELLEERLALQYELNAIPRSVSADILLQRTLELSLPVFRSRFGLIGRFADNGNLVCPAVAGNLLQGERTPSGEYLLVESDLPDALRAVLSGTRPTMNNSREELEQRILGCRIGAFGSTVTAMVIAGKRTDYDEEDYATFKLVASFLALALSDPPRD